MKIITLGEILLRLSTPNNLRFVRSNSFDIVYGGGEANVAITCANFGHDAYFVSRVPDNEIGQAAINSVNKWGVNTDYIVKGGDRLGIYFLETGASMRHSQVIYDRKNSSFAESSIDDFDFDAIMEGADWFHWSGIAPALSDQSALVIERACQAAKRHGVTVCLDFNYRSKLWGIDKARSVLLPLMEYVDVCIGSVYDAYNCLGFCPVLYHKDAHKYNETYEFVFEQMVKHFGLKYIVSTFRETYSANHNGWAGVIYNGKEFYKSKYYELNPIIDRVGGGDSFAGGLAHGILTKPTQGEALEFAIAASALKHTINGDSNHVTVEEVEELIDNHQ